ncbi:hypothetical protein B0H19DRAFT_1067506 [Mycena capillaripes]|nr:hypothetical protein B0H19DRAFT_1067506 [Mycena capillaripes]
MKPRAAKTTSKARKALAIAAAESKEDEDAAPRKRGRGRPPKPKSVPAPLVEELEGSDVDELVGPVLVAEGGVEIDWNGDHDLTRTLVTAIEEDEDTRRSLFPPPGAPQRNGGFAKKHFHWRLAKKCFEDHPLYQTAFEKAVTPKQQDVWSGKIKNRLGVVTDKTKAGIQAMGETGAGLESADDLQPGIALTAKWDELKKDSPWFWNIIIMRSLIAERPNLRPVSIGNNANDMDLSILLPTTDDDVAQTSSPGDDTTDFPESLGDLAMDTDKAAEDSNNPIAPDGEEDSDEEAPVKSEGKGAGKRRANSESTSVPPTKKTKPKPAISVPAASAQSKPAKPTNTKGKPTTTKEKFTATILAEEETMQRQLALQKEKARGRKEHHQN